MALDVTCRPPKHPSLRDPTRPLHTTTLQTLGGTAGLKWAYKDIGDRDFETGDSRCRPTGDEGDESDRRLILVIFHKY